MFRIGIMIDVEAVLPECAETVQRKVVQALKDATSKAPYPLKWYIGKIKPVGPVVNPASGVKIVGKA